jgi:DegV family protein with EDD domain
VSRPAGISYLDGPRLRRSLIAAADWVEAGREELNRINVFPVPDGDTGTNFAMTLRAAADGVRNLTGADLPTVAKVMAESCVFGARGNSGMLLSHFLLGFREGLGEQRVARLPEVAVAIRAGANRLHASLDEPVEGTILTVSRDAASAAETAARETSNLHEFMRQVLERAEASLRRTPELLQVLRDAGVVDAGAKAFVLVLEGVVRLIEGDPILPAAEPLGYTVPDAAAMAAVAAERDYGYCTEVLVRGSGFPSSMDIRARLRELGGSIVVLMTEDLLKIHIHTDTPDTLFDMAQGWGTIETRKADDMRAQYQELHEAHNRIAFVVDSSCDLPDDVVDRHGIVVVPLQVIEGTRTYLDRQELTGEELYRRMRAGTDGLTTSQPSPAAFLRAFDDATSQADEVLGIFIAGALSGTFASAQVAARSLSDSGSLTVMDSRSASLGLGLLALRAAELAQQGWERAAIVEELHRVRDHSGAIFTVDTFDNLLRSGRVSRGKAWLGGLLDIKPILELDQQGRVVPLDRVRGREALVPRVLSHLERRLAPRPTALRIGIVHADTEDVAEELRAEAVRRWSPRECIVSPLTAAVGVHTGPGAWGIFYQVED